MKLRSGKIYHSSTSKECTSPRFFEKAIPIDLLMYQYVDFEKLDARIKYENESPSTSPSPSIIYVPQSCYNEIILKLKSHEGIYSINGKKTLNGLKWEIERTEFSMNLNHIHR